VIATFWVTNTFAAGIVANFNATFMATVMVMIHLVRHQLPRRAFIWVFISLWISFEYLHHFWDLSWPWLTLGNALAQYPWAAQWYEYTGIFGGSLWILMVNFYGDDMINRWLRAQPLFWGRYVCSDSAHALSLWLWNTTTENTAEPVPVIVQTKFEPHYEKFDIPKGAIFPLKNFTNILISQPGISFFRRPVSRHQLNTFRRIRLFSFSVMVDSFPQLRLV
jgi:apolipoprotein N-acyltransferase